MRKFSTMPATALLIGLIATFPAARATPAAAPGVQIASSAMLVLNARIEKRDVVLHIVRAGNHTPIKGAGNVTADIDGHPVRVRAHGAAYVLATRALKGGAHRLQVIVAHDGIHELLSGSITLPKRPDRLAALEKHGYGAWWILNIVVLLIAARMIMRRKKPPPKGR